MYRLVLQDELGKELERLPDTPYDLQAILPTYGETGFPLLGYINPYGDTIFSSYQMKPFRAEWSQVFSRARNERDRELVLAVDSLAEVCARRVHTYLRFEGD